MSIFFSKILLGALRGHTPMSLPSVDPRKFFSSFFLYLCCPAAPQNGCPLPPGRSIWVPRSVCYFLATSLFFPPFFSHGNLPLFFPVSFCPHFFDRPFFSGAEGKLCLSWGTSAYCFFCFVLSPRPPQTPPPPFFTHGFFLLILRLEFALMMLS